MATFQIKNKKWQLFAMIAILSFLLLSQFILSWDYFYKTHSTLNPIGIDVLFIGIGIINMVGLIFGILNYHKIGFKYYNTKMTIKRFIAILIVVSICLLMLLNSFMAYYTDKFSKNHQIITTKVISVRKSNFRRGNYYITTEKFGEWAVSSRLYRSVSVGDELQMIQKESIFMTAIYEKEIRKISKTNQ